jgi:hypothetical protein
MLEDENGAPYPPQVQELVYWLEDSIEAAMRLSVKERMRADCNREKLIAFTATQAVYEEVLEKVRSLA